MNVSHVFLIITFGVYSILSKILFDQVYLYSKLIIDEEFHLPLGEQYCHFQFDKWDPKVTTLPGLYLLSALVLGPFKLCSVYWLRATSLLFSCLNLLLFYILFSCNVKGMWQKGFSALTMCLLPPLYFLSHIYYTDIVSLTTTLVIIILSERGHHFSASIAGLCSVLCRQTNIVFVAMYGGKYILIKLYAVWVEKEPKLKRDGVFPAKNLTRFIVDCIMHPVNILKRLRAKEWLDFLAYISVILIFITFVWINGSIVVGDKTAHQVSFNVPQVFYFSLFCLVFGWPHFVGEVTNFLLFTKRHKFLMCGFLLITALIVHYNTLVHPYLLADNRHFVFYIWNRFYGKFWWFRYIIIPVYVFALYVIFKLIWDKTDISFLLLYVPGIVLLLSSQTLLEFRYFLVPYIVLRSKIKNKDSAVFNVVLEFVTYCVVNMMTFNIFFTKTLTWDNYSFPQRIIW